VVAVSVNRSHYSLLYRRLRPGALRPVEVRPGELQKSNWKGARCQAVYPSGFAEDQLFPRVLKAVKYPYAYGVLFAEPLYPTLRSPWVKKWPRWDSMVPCSWWPQKPPSPCFPTTWRIALEDAGFAYQVYRFGGECSLAGIERVKRQASDQGARVVVGVGGGKVLDTARGWQLIGTCRWSTAPPWPRAMLPAARCRSSTRTMAYFSTNDGAGDANFSAQLIQRRGEEKVNSVILASEPLSNSLTQLKDHDRASVTTPPRHKSN